MSRPWQTRRCRCHHLHHQRLHHQRLAKSTGLLRRLCHHEVKVLWAAGTGTRKRSGRTCHHHISSQVSTLHFRAVSFDFFAHDMILLLSMWISRSLPQAEVPKVSCVSAIRSSQRARDIYIAFLSFCLCSPFALYLNIFMGCWPLHDPPRRKRSNRLAAFTTLRFYVFGTLPSRKEVDTHDLSQTISLSAIDLSLVSPSMC